MRKEFRCGPLGVYDFDKDDEIEIMIDDIDFESSVYLSRAEALELRDWLTERIEVNKLEEPG